MQVTANNTFNFALPGRRKFWLGLTVGLVALLVISVVVLEDYACDRFSVCVLSSETLLRGEVYAPGVTIVELSQTREAPVMEAGPEGLILTGAGSQAIFVASRPVAQEEQLRLQPATEAEIATGVARLAALSADRLARLTQDHGDILAAHPGFTADLATAITEPAETSTCAGIDRAGWRMATLAALAPGTGQDPTTLSLFLVALGCDADSLPGLAAAEGR